MSKILKITPEFSVLMKSPDTAEMVIYGRIGAGFFTKGLTTQTVDEELKKLPATVTKLTIRINSGGGSFFEGVGIYNRLKSFKAQKTVVVEALAGSAASLIMLSGDIIEMGTGAMMMIHLPMIFMEGNRIALDKMQKDLRIFEEQALNIYMDRIRAKSGKSSREEIRTKMIDETWLSGDECIKLGFADKISKTEAAKIAADCLSSEMSFYNRDKAMATGMFAAEDEQLRDKISEALKDINT